MKSNYCIKLEDTVVFTGDRLIALAPIFESIRNNERGIFASGKWTLYALDVALEAVTIKPKKNADK